MLKNISIGSSTAYQNFQLSARIHTYSNQSKKISKDREQLITPSKFRVSQKFGQTNRCNKIKSETQSPEAEKNHQTRSNTYRKIKSNVGETSGRFIKLQNAKILQQEISTSRYQAKPKYKIKTSGLLNNQFQQPSKFIRKRSVKQKSNYIILVTEEGAKSAEKLNKKRKSDDYTQLEQQQIKKYPIFYKSKRRIKNRKEFTDDDGNSIIRVGDAIAYRYQILSQLGQGAFGKVYKAYDHKKNEEVALKIIRSLAKLNQQAKIQIQILEKILQKDNQSHHNIVKIKGSFVFRGHTCITYELLKLNMYEYLKSHNFIPPHQKVLVKFTIQILQALFYLEKQNIVHCDIKPENIMLKDENKTGLKLIDFGSSCFQKKQIYSYVQSRYYRAPEIILGIKYTPAIDMWSFGCVIAELWTGYPIFPGEDQDQQMLMIMQLLGNPPNFILEKASRRKRFFNQNYECRILQSTKKVRLPKSLSFQKLLNTKQNVHLIKFIQKCLQWDPSKRMQPREALLHSWILQNLPQNLRVRHIVEITGESFDP